MNKIVLTIATINKNNALGLRGTITSVLMQRTDALEYIVVDGASNDDSGIVVAELSGGIDSFISENDAGISDAFNKAISRSSGEWILLLNSGDRLISGVMNRIIEVLENSSADIVIFSTKISGGIEDGKVLCPKYKNIRKEMSIAHPSTFVRASVYKKFGLYDLRLKFAMDYEFFLRSYNRLSVEEHLEILVDMDGSGVSSSNIVKRNIDCWYARKFNNFLYFENLYFTTRRLVRECMSRRQKSWFH